jgi:hypothetical protein
MEWAAGSFGDSEEREAILKEIALPGFLIFLLASFEMAPVDELGHLETAPKNLPLRGRFFSARDNISATLRRP